MSLSLAGVLRLATLVAAAWLCSPATARLDIASNGVINISGLGRLLPPTFGTSCA